MYPLGALKPWSGTPFPLVVVRSGETADSCVSTEVNVLVYVVIIDARGVIELMAPPPKVSFVSLGIS